MHAKCIQIFHDLQFLSLFSRSGLPDEHVFDVLHLNVFIAEIALLELVLDPFEICGGVHRSNLLRLFFGFDGCLMDFYFGCYGLFVKRYGNRVGLIEALAVS